MKSAQDNLISPVSQLKNLGPRSASWLNAVGIYTLGDLMETGPISAYLKVKQTGSSSSLNLLYALIGAVEDVHWTEVKRTQKHDLVLLLDAMIQGGSANE